MIIHGKLCISYARMIPYFYDVIATFFFISFFMHRFLLQSFRDTILLAFCCCRYVNLYDIGFFLFPIAHLQLVLQLLLLLLVCIAIICFNLFLCFITFWFWYCYCFLPPFFSCGQSIFGWIEVWTLKQSFILLFAIVCVLLFYLFYFDFVVFLLP